VPLFVNDKHQNESKQNFEGMHVGLQKSIPKDSELEITTFEKIGAQKLRRVTFFRKI